MPRYCVKYVQTYKVSPNYVPAGMHEGQEYAVELETTLTARNEKQARAKAFEGFAPENEYVFGRKLVSVELLPPRSYY